MKKNNQHYKFYFYNKTFQKKLIYCKKNNEIN